MTEELRAKFTPGPWSLTTAGNGFRRPSERHQDMAIIGASGVCPGIVWMSDNGERDGIMAEMRANARLIAAAPELYEALKAMVDRWEPDCIGTDRRMYDDACAALAKATPDASTPDVRGSQSPHPGHTE